MRTADHGRRASAVYAASSRDSRAAGIIASLGRAALTLRFDAHDGTVKGSRRYRRACAGEWAPKGAPAKIGEDPGGRVALPGKGQIRFTHARLSR
ncbi:hypothetical protein SAV14893_023210 [Streptomyces avermitilis]|uniref:Uncharacterized protein n=1 Tax=Streptomyces avermitilis TaxID=33903 RepID=A0A4D4LX02_STRAX|nr:hypothetical protein SAVMC3_35270 [Streptomyces avermitilis]GDY62928.1 hypothetical protein SAV14893_023210 [Streptomyces avermitilis]GDY76950.1 hypothetical protein SAV31267_064350 [Streptomyces avermitilis]GDY85865.1 hypothetical protein SAVCW2_50640 [Streptomyces avermitilis]